VKQKKRHPGGMMPPRPLRKLKPLTPMMGPMGPMPPHHMPPGGTLSPCGDLGALGQDETFRVFSNPVKVPKKQIMRAADALPYKEKTK
jgi:hypothetical protein